MRSVLLFCLILLTGLSACNLKKADSMSLKPVAFFGHLNDSLHPVYPDSVLWYLRSHLSFSDDTTVCDSVLTIRYWSNDKLFWLNDENGSKADSLLYWLENVNQHGVNPRLFSVSAIREKLNHVRSLNLLPGESMNRLLAEIEYQLTASYLLYVCGLEYGFLPPACRRNDSISFIPMKRCDRSFVWKVLGRLESDPLSALHDAQPTSSLYRILQKQLRQIETSDKDLYESERNSLLVNLERARWKYEQEKGRKFVIVSTAAFMLQAVDLDADSIMEMKICCGDEENKTPLLSSKIYYMELNPYWNVPQNIIRKEIIPAYSRDTTYFTRNRMKVYDKNGIQIDPHKIKWFKFADEKEMMPYTVKQDNKEGNSLGRIIFRFPNPYSVYLHDTPSRAAFARANRAVSHGCIRLEKALDFAFFLLKAPDELLKDRIRMAMDMEPESEEGKELPMSAAFQELKHYSLKEYIPLYIDYQTVYLSASEKLSFCKDVYQYDEPLLKTMEYYRLKP